MIHRELLLEELNNKRDEFDEFARSQSVDFDDYFKRFSEFASRRFQEVYPKLANLHDCGAVPTEEMNLAENFSLKFAGGFGHHEDARRWANEILDRRTTFAADGSQLFLEREVSLPVAAVQIGWFENHHDPARPYVKNASVEILSPADLLTGENPFLRETVVGQRRFLREIERIRDFIARAEGWESRGERLPVAFYDNTLLLSIASVAEDFQHEFIDHLVDLVRHSEAAHVPVVGFVDRSYARDLMTMVDVAGGRRAGGSRTLDDVTILGARHLRSWGDRTPFCRSRRRGLDAFFDEDKGESSVGFVYLRTTSDSPPARLDIPSWVYDEGMIDEVTDAVRAECIVGLGYPYALETADQTAVITVRDREVFLHALQGFANENNLNLRISRKAASKQRRR